MTVGVTPTGGLRRRTGAALSWSEWQDFDEAHRGKVIPATPGIYRFPARDKPGLLYLGESGEEEGGAGAWAVSLGV